MQLVAGATGTLGFEICRRLRAQGEPVRALVRRAADRSKIEQLADLGVGLAWGDLKDPASVAAACRGATGVLTTVAPTLSRQPVRAGWTSSSLP
jgi:uncharacterized protein YbjT (DUF2867 family)